MKIRFRYYRGVRYVAPWKPAPADFSRCNTCGRAWDDSKPTALTPAPAARCPFEYMHKGGATAENPPDDWKDCGCCGGMHPPGFTGDCRDDANSLKGCGK